MERSKDPIMYSHEDVNIYDGYQTNRQEILMNCEKFPPKPDQANIKVVDGFMIRTQTADFTAMDFSPQRQRQRPLPPKPPLPPENSRDRSASSAAAGGGPGISIYEPIDNHRPVPNIERVFPGGTDDYPFVKEVNMNGIFTCSSPGLFFRSVDALLLFQCFFMAIVFTQLIPLLTYGLTSVYNPGWIVGFILLILFNFYIIQLMLNKAVLLRAVYQV